MGNEYSYNKDYKLYLKQEDYRYPFFLNPLNFILDRLEQGNPSLVLISTCLQNLMRETLYIFLNYPFSLLIYKYYKDKFLKMLPLVEYLNSRGVKLRELRKNISFLKDNMPLRPMSFLASLFCVFYEEFPSSLHGLVKTIDKKSKPSCPTFNVEEFPLIEKDKKYLMPLKRLQTYGEKKFSEDVYGFYLHGSFATMDYVKNWSDVDTLLVLKKETFQDVNRLMRFQKVVYKATGHLYLIDPFQSHGFFIISEFDLNYYSETYFPLELFKYSKSFLKDDNVLEFKVRDSKLERMEILWRDVVHYLRRMLIESKESKSLTNDKIRMLLHKIYIFPVFYLQAKGIHCYKKYSFDMARSYFTKEEWRPIEIANRVWKEWEVDFGYRSLPAPLFSLSPLLTGVCLKRFYNFNKDIFYRYHIDYWKLLVDANRLIETAWYRLLEENAYEIF